MLCHRCTSYGRYRQLSRPPTRDFSACAGIPAALVDTVREREVLLYKAVKMVELAHGAVTPSRAVGLFFPHMSARIVMHSVVVQAHVRKTYWDELADLPTQPCLCTVSPHQGSSKWEARGRRLGLSLRTQPAVLDTMARSSSISTTGRTSRRFAAGNEALRSSLSSNPLFRLTLPCKSR